MGDIYMTMQACQDRPSGSKMLFVLVALFSVVSAQTASDCTQFCTDYNATCVAANAAMGDIYMTMQACQDECMKFPMDSNCPVGAITDAATCSAGNSWGCRRYHLNVAMSNAADPSIAMTHCPHTTPLSSPTADITGATAITGTVCGTMINGTAQNGLVADFCNQVTASGVCSAYLGGLDMTKCAQFYGHIGGNTDVSNYADGTNRKFPLAAVSNSGLSCRRYHAQVARTSAANAMEHCPHALFGDDACGSTCETLCTLGTAICPGKFDSNCMADCGSKVPAAVDFSVITNKDIVCRIYHLSVASTSAAAANTHCDHATIVSTPDTCGTGAASTASFSVFLIAALALITKFSS
jgi:hypothetical protein